MLLEARGIGVHFATPRGLLRAVNGVSLEIEAGETLGLVGESGCGKSTLGRAIMRLVPIAEGALLLENQDITRLEGASLNPRRRVGSLVGQPLSVAGWSRRDIADRVAELLAQVSLPKDAVDRYPHEFSGGQRQRIGIARALALSPKLVICDEPVSALDVSVRAQVVNLLKDIQDRLGVGYLFISHDLSVVENVADRLMVMYLGRVVEQGRAADVLARPAHPYTHALLSAAPVANPALARARQRVVLQGELPSPVNPPSGCTFRTRCPYAEARCAAEAPALRPLGDQRVACHFDFGERFADAATGVSA